LFGIFELAKDLLIIAVIVALVAPLARLLRRRAPDGRARGSAAPPA
jgi:hypothetical protein